MPATRVLRLVDNPPRFISAIQLGVTLSSLALGAIGEPVVSDILRSPLDLLPESWHTSVATTIAVILAFIILSFFHVVMGEIVPKSFTLEHAERVSLVVAGPINWFYALFRPFIWVLVKSSNAVLRWIGRDRSERALARPLRGGAEDARDREPGEGRARGRGAGDAPQRLRVRRQGRGRRDGAASRRRRGARRDAGERGAARRPRPPVHALPGVRGASSTTSLGILHVRDLFSALHDRGIERVDLRAILRPAIVVPETKHLDELLAEFQTTSNHMAIVVDEYGSVEGLVTLEDLLEEIVGEIGDEFDRPEAGVLRIGRGRVRIGGSFPIDEFNERFGTRPARRRLPHGRRVRLRRARPGAPRRRHWSASTGPGSRWPQPTGRGSWRSTSRSRRPAPRRARTTAARRRASRPARRSSGPSSRRRT